jgi:hypothetical protein
MDIYFSSDDEILLELREFCKNYKPKIEELGCIKHAPPVYRPILFGEDNGFYGRKHKPEQIKSWSEMRLGEKNPNYGGKAFTEETYKKLRRPKTNTINYRGSPGKITCIDKSGKAIQISKDLYNEQKSLDLPIEEWEYVNTNSKEAKKRKANIK